MLGLAFALVAVGAGVAAIAALRLERKALALAPAIGLAVLPALSVWLVLLNVPTWLAGAVLLVLPLLSALLVRGERRQRPGWTAGLLALAVVLPAVLLGLAFGDLEVPTSVHDGAFHV